MMYEIKSCLMNMCESTHGAMSMKLQMRKRNIILTHGACACFSVIESRDKLLVIWQAGGAQLIDPIMRAPDVLS